jgi:hypothetical protein
MLNGKSILKFIYINIGFVVLNIYILVMGRMQEIKQNWPKYRCNPSYMFLADNITENFLYCITQTSGQVFSKLSGPILDGQSGSNSAISSLSGAMKGLTSATAGATDGIGMNFTNLLATGGPIMDIFMYFIVLYLDIIKRVTGIIQAYGYVLESSYDGVGAAENWLLNKFQMATKT